MVSGAEGYHGSHIHPRAWMSGVYYVARLEISRAPGTRCGWLRVGPPDYLGLAEDSGWRERLVEPEPGNLVLMPGYFCHGTQPMGVDQDRICIAFDMVPGELAESDRIADDY